MRHPIQPVRVVNSVAPIRICDNGGWTDTWFAQHGAIFNVGVYPYAEVQVAVYERDVSPDRIVIHAENYGERYVLHPEQPGWIRHPLLEAAIERMRVPHDIAVQVTIFSEAPAGASTGTSAAVAVALVGALDCLTPGRLSAHEAAYTAHAIEVEMLKRQSGIQDQLCSAYGGVNYIEMFAYPHASVSQLQAPNDIWWELERRLVLIYLGKSHDSSQVHEKVIAQLEDAGPDCKQLNDLRVTAAQSRGAVLAGDFAALGRAMRDNTDAQGRLHPDLVSREAQRVIAIAQAHSALGWKVNGAGGDGGSLTILASDLSHEKRAMIRAIEAERVETLHPAPLCFGDFATSPPFKNIPIYLSRHGLRVWETKGN